MLQEQADCATWAIARCARACRALPLHSPYKIKKLSYSYLSAAYGNTNTAPKATSTTFQHFFLLGAIFIFLGLLFRPL